MGSRGVIFDVDGTLLDTMPVWTNSGAMYLKTLGIEAEENLGDRLFPMTAEGGAEYIKENYGLPESVAAIKKGILAVVEAAYFSLTGFKPGAEALLQRLKAKEIPMAIATSTDRYCITAAFDRLGYTGYFEAILSCADLSTTKAEPEIFYRAAELMGTDITKTWVVEDGLYAIKTAKAAGFRTIGVYDEVSRKDQQEIRRLADIYAESLTELTERQEKR